MYGVLVVQATATFETRSGTKRKWPIAANVDMNDVIAGIWKNRRLGYRVSVTANGHEYMRITRAMFYRLYALRKKK